MQSGTFSMFILFYEIWVLHMSATKTINLYYDLPDNWLLYAAYSTMNCFFRTVIHTFQTGYALCGVHLTSFHHFLNIQTHRATLTALTTGDTCLIICLQPKSRNMEKICDLFTDYHKGCHPAKAMAHSFFTGS